MEQSFGYDGANRLNYAHENSGWTQNYVFDAQGNRAVSANAYIPSPAYTPQTYDSSVPYDEHNHWTGATYDPSGVGTLKSVGSQSMTYDAENRLSSLNDTGLGTYTTFTYLGRHTWVLIPTGRWIPRWTSRPTMKWIGSS